MTTFDLLDIPLPGRLRLPSVAVRHLPNGLRLVAARRSSVPMAELCVSIPFANTDSAVAVMLASSLTTDPDVQKRLRYLGAGMSAAVDVDHLRIVGSVLTDYLPDFLALLADLLTAPTYPADEFATALDSAKQRTVAMLADPATRALQAINHRLYGDHPYGQPIPSVDALAEVTRDAVVSLHADRIRTTGASLVIAGDFEPEYALDEVAKALSSWQPGDQLHTTPLPPEIVPGELVVHQPGSTQSLLRMAFPVPTYGAPYYSALSMATLVFGGYFSSRLVQNIREEKGFAYSPRASVLHIAKASLATIMVDVVTANTAAAVAEVKSELRELVTRPVTVDELDRARRYALGTQRLRMATLTGLTSTLCELDLHDLPLDWLGGHDARLNSVTPEQVTEAAAKYLTPERGVTVLLCDKAKVFPST